MRMLVLLLSVFAVGVIPTRVMAQGYRVETRVYDAAPKEAASAKLISSSLTLFQNGKVYDYVESADEVIIFEPTARQFTILNLARSLQTTVTFDEIRHLLDLRRAECENYVREITDSGHPEAGAISSRLRFQLDPEFETVWDGGTQSLRLLSPSWRYQVATHPWQDPDQVEQYLDYADWIARLNFVLHPSSRFPEPRMALNRELRSISGRMPTSVMLDLRPYDFLVLRADHKFVMDLNAADRNFIQLWEAAAKNGTLAKKSFRSYQEAVLVTQR